MADFTKFVGVYLITSFDFVWSFFCLYLFNKPLMKLNRHHKDRAVR